MVVDRYFVGVSSQILNHLFWTKKGTLGVYDPIFRHHRFGDGLWNRDLFFGNKRKKAVNLIGTI
jgi:hypothetical protein